MEETSKSCRGIRKMSELKSVIGQGLADPTEVHSDISQTGIKYYLKKLNDLWLTIITRDTEVKTAYLIGSKTYQRFRAKRWL
jgi:hypothetical protein